jgi:hypothetical protein
VISSVLLSCSDGHLFWPAWCSPVSDLLRAGQLVRMTLPCLIIFRGPLDPSKYFSLFIRSWSLELIYSSNFFIFLVATIFCHRYGMVPNLEQIEDRTEDLGSRDSTCRVPSITYILATGAHLPRAHTDFCLFSCFCFGDRSHCATSQALNSRLS